MIYPSRLAVLAAAACAPLALVVGLLFPAFYLAGSALLGVLAALMIIDLATAPPPGSLSAELAGPGTIGVGDRLEVEARVRFERSTPAAVEVALDRSALAEAQPAWTAEARLRGGQWVAPFHLTALRRGRISFDRMWVRWKSGLGLIWRQARLAPGGETLVIPNVRAVRERSARLFHRDVMHGLIARLQTGEGAEFDALAEYSAGMDKRAIDWKQSARHSQLLAKEFRAERNNNIIIAVDSGRTMCEPINGVPRVDRAVSAALVTAFVALKDGDRVGLFGFDSRPRISTRPVSGGRSFALIQKAAAGLEYSDQESNYTLALATLTSGLKRRSLIIVFTEFADTVSAEQMVKAVGAVLRRHLVLFVLFRDEELERFTEAQPEVPEDITKAVTAASLLKERRVVIGRLRRMGVHVVEAAHDEAGPALVNAYVSLKRRNLL